MNRILLTLPCSFVRITWKEETMNRFRRRVKSCAWAPSKSSILASWIFLENHQSDRIHFLHIKKKLGFSCVSCVGLAKRVPSLISGCAVSLRLWRVRWTLLGRSKHSSLEEEQEEEVCSEVPRERFQSFVPSHFPQTFEVERPCS